MSAKKRRDASVDKESKKSRGDNYPIDINGLILGHCPLKQTFKLSDVKNDVELSDLEERIRGMLRKGLNVYAAVNGIYLWKVSIPINPEDEKLKILSGVNTDGRITDIDAIKEKLGAEDMIPNHHVSNYWSDQPPEKRIHIIVHLSSAAIDSQDVEMTDASLYTPRRGGLGGTFRVLTAGVRVPHFEGISLNGYSVCLREQTTQKLANKIWEAGFLLVRSPPMSGKTSLAQLLEQHLLKGSNVRVIHISLSWMADPWKFDEGFEYLMGISWRQFCRECDHIRTVLIIDDVQVLYVQQDQPSDTLHHNSNVLLDVFKECQQSGNLGIVAFADHGYNSAWDSAATPTMDVSLYAIPSENTWSLEDMRFTEDEYNNYVSSLCGTYLGMKEEDITHLRNYIRKATDRHPGLVALFMSHIVHRFNSQLDDDEDLEFGEIFLYLMSDQFKTVIDTLFRAYPVDRQLTPEEMELCDRVFQEPINLRETDITSGKLVRTNLLGEKDGKLHFVSPYFRALYLQRRGRSTRGSFNKLRDFKSFLRATFANVNDETIRNMYSVGTDGRLLECAWQKEFYRAATRTVPSFVHISLDVGICWESSGYLDFWVDNKSWAIKLLCGSNASDPKARPEEVVIYEPIKKVLKELAIIDIRYHTFQSKKKSKNMLADVLSSEVVHP